MMSTAISFVPYLRKMLGFEKPTVMRWSIGFAMLLTWSCIALGSYYKKEAARNGPPPCRRSERQTQQIGQPECAHNWKENMPCWKPCAKT